MISIEVDGRIVELPVDLGDQVKKGDVLCRIMPVEYEWKKTQADADLLKAEADFKRMQKLHSDKVIAKEQVDENQRKFDVARAAADLARKKLADTVLRAPFEGAVAKRLVNSGEYVRSGSAAFQIVRLQPIKFRGDVPERYAGDVHRDDHVLAYTDAGRDHSFPGTIERVGPSVASDSRSFPIEASIDNSEGKIKPGSFALMTTITLIAGMIPIALGSGPGAAPRASMAKVIIGDQALSLLITLLIVPVCYSLFAGMKARMSGVKKMPVQETWN